MIKGSLNSGYLLDMGGVVDHVVGDGEEVHGEALDRDAEDRVGVVDVVDDDLGIVSESENVNRTCSSALDLHYKVVRLNVTSYFVV